MSAHKTASHITAFHREWLNHRPWHKHGVCVCVCERTWPYEHAEGWLSLSIRAAQTDSLLSEIGFILGIISAVQFKVAHIRADVVKWLLFKGVKLHPVSNLTKRGSFSSYNYFSLLRDLWVATARTPPCVKMCICTEMKPWKWLCCIPLIAWCARSLTSIYI